MRTTPTRYQQAKWALEDAEYARDQAHAAFMNRWVEAGSPLSDQCPPEVTRLQAEWGATYQAWLKARARYWAAGR